MSRAYARPSGKSVPAPKSDRADVYTTITDKIVEALEKGVRPWMRPWGGGRSGGIVSRPLRHNFKPYSGVNVLMLWLEAEAKGYDRPVWMTFNQARQLGGCVRKGEKGTHIIFYKTVVKERETEGGEKERDKFPLLRTYVVFNVGQIDGLPARFYGDDKPAPPKPEGDAPAKPERIPAADAYFSNVGADFRHGGDSAYYMPNLDFIKVPKFEAFRDAAGYYGTVGHEFIHWTKKETRCNRDYGKKSWGDEGYATEELVAEMGAAFLVCDLGICPVPREDHASYLAHWLKVLKSDNKFIFRAAAAAQKAVDYLHGLQPNGGFFGACNEADGTE